MEIIDVFNIAEKQLAQTNEELNFKKTNSDDGSVIFAGEKGAYKIAYNKENNIVSFECCYDYQADEPKFETISRSLFDPETYNEKDAKSLGNEINDEIAGIFKTRKKVDLDKVKMPKAVSRTKVKNGIISYDCDSLANRFGTLYPEFKDDIKANIVAYGEFLPETFFNEKGTAKVLDVIKNGNAAERKKLFKMLNDVYEDGTNEVQDVIGVTILGAIQNDKDLMAICDEYMSDYMSGPVHEINKLTAKKNSSLMKKLKNPPAYKPKKKKNNFMQNALQAQDINR